ncbi:hypothetical protein [Halobacillus sp. B23F22_1]|uniref:hypothetical protein n=1 Tax=Halobacillus sp. B23F22_1 TaxID=3459514 RepID=UPI00373EBAE5
MKTLHILNGKEMHKTFVRRGFLKGETIAPFNEAMCDGAAHETVFSQAFIQQRAATHGVPVREYRKITIDPLSPLFHENYPRIALWFDEDMFCQINILTILAWLDQTEYAGEVELTIVDDHMYPVDTIPFHVKGYHAVYKSVILNKKMTPDVKQLFLKRGIELYLNHKKDLIKFIQQHPEHSDKEILDVLLSECKEYGLGDVQYRNLVKTARGKESGEWY